MPHATHAYPFEAKVGAFGGDLCRRFTAGGALRAFVLVLDDAGSVQALTFADGSPQWRERVQALETAGTPHLFHDPLFYVSPRGRNVFMALALGKPRKLGAWPTIAKIEFYVFPSTVSTEADPCRIAISRPALLSFSLRQAILSSLRAGLQFIIADLLF